MIAVSNILYIDLHLYLRRNHTVIYFKFYQSNIEQSLAAMVVIFKGEVIMINGNISGIRKNDLKELENLLEHQIYKHLIIDKYVPVSYTHLLAVNRSWDIVRWAV